MQFRDFRLRLFLYTPSGIASLPDYISLAASRLETLGLRWAAAQTCPRDFAPRTPHLRFAAV